MFSDSTYRELLARQIAELYKEVAQLRIDIQALKQAPHVVFKEKETENVIYHSTSNYANLKIPIPGLIWAILNHLGLEPTYDPGPRFGVKPVSK
jgi:hypothetical protein